MYVQRQTGRASGWLEGGAAAPIVDLEYLNKFES